MPTLTAKGAATRQRLVEATAVKVRADGVAGTSLDDVMVATGTSKGQLFHYFPDGRADLLLAVAHYEADRVLSDQQPYLDRLDSLDAWNDWRKLVVRRYRQQGQSCPLSALLSELGRGDPAVAAVVTNLLETWEACLMAGIKTMQASGEFDPTLNPRRAAAALLAGLQGGASMMLITGSIKNLDAALDLGISSLKAQPLAG